MKLTHIIYDFGGGRLQSWAAPSGVVYDDCLVGVGMGDLLDSMTSADITTALRQGFEGEDDPGVIGRASPARSPNPETQEVLTDDQARAYFASFYRD